MFLMKQLIMINVKFGAFITCTCQCFRWLLLQKCYKFRTCHYTNNLMLDGVHFPTLALISTNCLLLLPPCGEAAGPLKSGIMLFALVHQRWVLFATWTLDLWFFIATYWTVTSWSRLETCTRYFPRWANLQAEFNNTLTQLLTKKH
jgi:hypothetical protein